MKKFFAFLISTVCALTLTAQTYYAPEVVTALPQYSVETVESGDSDLLRTVVLTRLDQVTTAEENMNAIDSVLTVQTGDWVNEEGSYKKTVKQGRNLIIIFVTRKDDNPDDYLISIHECANVF